MATSPITSGSILRPVDPSLQLQTTTKKASNQLDQNAFLNLMVEQFKNQNPLSPQDPSQFLSQLAQFSSVQGISAINTSLSSLTSAMYANQALQASNIVGHDILTKGSSATLTADQPLKGAVDLPSSTATGFVQIFDASGAFVRELPLGSQNAGLANFQWDGTTASGSKAPPGTYLIQAGYRDGAQATAADTLVSTKVTSVALGSDGKQAQITTQDGQQLALADIRAIF